MEFDAVELSARYKNWIVIKKLTIRDNTTPEEIVFHLASIRQTIDRKAFEFLGLDTATLDAYADSITKGKGKKFADLGAAIQTLGSPEAKLAIEKGCAGKEIHKEVANAYLLRRVMQNLKFDVDVNQEMLARVYPNLKVPKPRGRLPKQ